MVVSGFLCVVADFSSAKAQGYVKHILDFSLTALLVCVRFDHNDDPNFVKLYIGMPRLQRTLKKFPSKVVGLAFWTSDIALRYNTNEFIL